LSPTKPPFGGGKKHCIIANIGGVALQKSFMLGLGELAANRGGRRRHRMAEILNWGSDLPRQCYEFLVECYRSTWNCGFSVHLEAKRGTALFREKLSVDLDGVFYTTQLVLKNMVSNGNGDNGGRIINISSIFGQTGNFGQVNYAAAKGAIISFTESLARELARKGITVNAVAPGFVETDMVSGMPEAALAQVKAMTPMGRLGKPEEIADAVVFLASPRSSFVTGQVLAVNGGMYM